MHNDKYKNKYRIQSNRWQFWDYSAPAGYFLTVCITNRECILGNIKSGIMILSEYGKIVENEIQKIPQYHKRAILDISVVMPNHIHCIVTLGDYDFDNGVSLIGDDNNNDNICSNGGNNGGNVEKIHEFSLQVTENDIKEYRKRRRKMIIPKILGKLQQQTSKHINIVNDTPGKKNWQPNYHDHVIRQGEYERIYNYILSNPKKWNDDRFYKNM